MENILEWATSNNWSKNSEIIATFSGCGGRKVNGWEDDKCGAAETPLRRKAEVWFWFVCGLANCGWAGQGDG
jgi:hypothetical protein